MMDSCVPKKMTWNFASINETIKAGKHYGYTTGEVSFDFKSFVEKRDARIKVLNGAYETNWAKEGIELIHATATFVSAHELEIKPKDGSEAYRISAPHITIATGSFPTKPEKIPGSQYGITSDEYFLIKHLPKKMVFVGAGYIAVELAGVMNAIGVETHLFIRGNTFLRKFDPMIQETLTKHYEEAGVIVHRNHPGIKEVIQLNPGADESDPREKQLKIISNDGSEIVTNELLWAIGRGPETRDLGLESLDIKLNSKGHIVVDKYQNSSVEGVYALGDVTGQVWDMICEADDGDTDDVSGRTYPCSHRRRTTTREPTFWPTRVERIVPELRPDPVGGVFASRSRDHGIDGATSH